LSRRLRQLRHGLPCACRLSATRARRRTRELAHGGRQAGFQSTIAALTTTACGVSKFSTAYLVRLTPRALRRESRAASDSFSQRETGPRRAKSEGPQINARDRLASYDAT